MNKSLQRILTRDLQFSSTILSPLSHADYMRSNRLMYKISKHSYGTGKSPSFDVTRIFKSITLDAVSYLKWNYHVYIYKGKNAAKESTWDYFLKEPPLIDLLTNNT